MSKINVLPKNVSELIAAGEVIERPSSIVKELLENSIDAGSTAVTVEIKKGGIEYLRVTDNGCGIEPEDMPTAFLRHATSKILLADDLNFISTLGFRGEALASICAVSKVELISKTSVNQFGARIIVNGGEQISFDTMGCPDGTTIIVRNLFYNVPARLKFLKRDIAEANAISGIIDKIALSHPEVSIKFINENKVKLHTPGNGDLLSTIHSVFGDEISSNVIPVNYGYEDISVNGYISKSGYGRANRSMQHFFVNSRYIRSRLCMAAIEEGYKNKIMIGKYPVCILNIQISCDNIDINVHPTKTEVRFINEKPVFDAVYFATKSALSKEDILKDIEVETKPKQNVLSQFENPSSEQIRFDSSQNDIINATFEKPKLPEIPPEQANHEYVEVKGNKIINVIPERKEDFINNNDDTSFYNKSSIKAEKEEFKFIDIDKFNSDNNSFEKDNNEDNSIIAEPTKNTEYNFKIIGEIFKTYLVFESDERILLLDKHAAHERIIYEKLKKCVDTEIKQVLLQPVVVTVSYDELNAISENMNIVSKMGFKIDEFGNNSLIIREVPMVLANYDIADIFLDITQKLIKNRHDVSSNVFENLLHSIACRSAIKANDKNSIEELTELLHEVIKNDEIRNCPHGRPVVIEISKADIEKKFGRIQ